MLLFLTLSEKGTGILNCLYGAMLILQGKTLMTG